MLDRSVHIPNVVRKEFLTAERAAYEAEPIILAPWDPMGALADK